MPLLAPRPAVRRPRFHPLTVERVEGLTDRSVAVTFDVPEDLREQYAFAPGQHLTLRAVIDGEEVRQSYSICQARSATGGPEHVRVASARVEGGRMSTWLNTVVRPGDEIDVMTPMGSFTCPTRPDEARHHVAVAAGSGITPVLALLTTALQEEPLSRVTLLYGNRSTASVMFLEELEDLKNRYPGRFHLVTVLSREPQEVELFSGRLDPERLARILDALVPVADVDEWYLCGPMGLVTGAQALLAGRGVDPRHVHHEIFHVVDPERPDGEGPAAATTRSAAPVAPDAPPVAVVTVRLDGRTTEVPMANAAESILAATLRVRPDAPFSCTNGVCGTCRAHLVEGQVTMSRNYALEPDEVARGVVLACQAHPASSTVTLDYDT